MKSAPHFLDTESRNPMTIDYDRVRMILDENPPLDAYRSYYQQYSARHTIIGPLVPDTRQLLQSAFQPHMHVVDVGCGRGDTLFDSAAPFRWGTGIDESVDVMLAAANEAKARTPDIPTLIRKTGRVVNPTASANSTNRIDGDHVSPTDVDSTGPVGATGIPAGPAGMCRRNSSETNIGNGEHACEGHDKST